MARHRHPARVGLPPEGALRRPRRRPPFPGRHRRGARPCRGDARRLRLCVGGPRPSLPHGLRPLRPAVHPAHPRWGRAWSPTRGRAGSGGRAEIAVESAWPRPAAGRTESAGRGGKAVGLWALPLGKGGGRWRLGCAAKKRASRESGRGGRGPRGLGWRIAGPRKGVHHGGDGKQPCASLCGHPFPGPGAHAGGRTLAPPRWTQSDRLLAAGRRVCVAGVGFTTPRRRARP